MSMAGKIIVSLGISVVVGSLSTAAVAASKRTNAAANTDVSSTAFPFGKRTDAAAAINARQLVRLMDTDKNGTVSKDEFMQFMSQTFDRLDVNKSGELEREELRQLDDPDWIICHDMGICYQKRRITR